jgi:arginase family enzyme
VDVINSTEFQLGKFPYYAGLASEDAIAALEVFVGSEKLVGLVITEVNPGNDGSVEMVERLVDGIVGAFRNKA